MKTPDIQHWKLWKVAMLCVATSIFGFIPLLGIPGALIFTILTPLPFVYELLESLPGDAGWGAAIAMTLIAPALFFAALLIMRQFKNPWITAKKRFWIFAFIVYISWYGSSLWVLSRYVQLTQEIPGYGTMMQYLP